MTELHDLDMVAFWKLIKDKYPEIYTDFGMWKNEYERRSGIAADSFKFARAMQLGIFIQYTIENGGVFFSDACPDLHSFPAIMAGVERWFQMETELVVKLRQQDQPTFF